MRLSKFLAALLLLSAPALADPDPALQAMVAQQLAAGPQQTRYGLLVTTLDGQEVVAIAPDQRFVPASNTKIFTTAATFAELPGLDQATRGTSVALEGGSVVLYGHGDARLSSAADCAIDCLARLADAVAAQTHSVIDVIGDDSWYPDERWSPGMSWNNVQTRFGTAISALTLDDNSTFATVTPGTAGSAPVISGPGWYTIDNQIRMVAGAENHLGMVRLPNSMTLRLTGTLGVKAAPVTLWLGIDEPAHFAAWRFRQLLQARGVTVSGEARARHRPPQPVYDPSDARHPPAVLDWHEPSMLAELPGLPLADDIRITNKLSQNLHAELFLRRLSRAHGDGSIADGQTRIDAMMAQAGIPATSYEFADGSGMSTYNRITPRAAVTMLRWIASQPWGMAWRDTLPIGGTDGSLKSRFKGSILEGKIFAKTGSLNGARALSGYMIAKSGRMLVFSALANDFPAGQDGEASAAVDRVLIALAEKE